jgi:hypothetical protein
VNLGDEVIALSAAMPGLSGAIYRRNSIHASLRSVQYKTQDNSGTPAPVTIRLKLFNTVARDRGPDLLKQGVTIHAGQLVDFLSPREWLARYIDAVDVNGKNIHYDDLPQSLASKNHIQLQLIVTD